MMKAGTERKPENKMFKDSTKNASLLFVVFAGVCMCVRVHLTQLHVKDVV